MNKDCFEALCQKYTEYIKNIINSNVKFYRFYKKIQWQFGYDKQISIFACCNSKTNVITVNVAAVDCAFKRNEPLQIENFLLHEIRHIYQHLEIAGWRTDPTKCANVKLAELWAEESTKYVPALDKNGNENSEYFAQDMEMDAFAYAYAIMKYKYGTIHYLYVPEAYKNVEFDKLVTEWMNTFDNENL